MNRFVREKVLLLDGSLFWDCLDLKNLIRGFIYYEGKLFGLLLAEAPCGAANSRKSFPFRDCMCAQEDISVLLVLSTVKP